MSKKRRSPARRRAPAGGLKRLERDMKAVVRGVTRPVRRLLK